MIKQRNPRKKWEGFNFIIGRYIVISKSIIKEQMKESRVMIPCPICYGSVLNHQKKLQFGDFDIREIIHQSIDEVIKTVGELPELEKNQSHCWGRYVTYNRCFLTTLGNKGIVENA